MIGKSELKIIISCLTWIVLLSTNALAQWPTGNQTLQQVENWPIYREGVICGQVSSADPTGGDDDGSSFLYQQDSLFVIFDQDGPGCVYRLWIRNVVEAPNRLIKIYFDNQADPTISTTIANLFNGNFQNFRTPLVGNGSSSSGGNYCYLPLPYVRHLKIALVDGTLPHQITYHQYPPGTPIAPYSAVIPDSILQQWSNTGTDPKDPFGNLTSSGNMVVAPNQTQAIFTHSGSGSITGLLLNLNPSTLSVLQSLRLRCTWDDASLPQVDSPIGAFFANTQGMTPVAGLPLGVQNNQYYCYFPMPFWQSARIELYNTSFSISVSVNYTVTYKGEPYPEESGYFCAIQKPYSVSEPAQELVLGELSGHGQLAGMSVTLISSAGPSYLHGDLRMYSDGMAYPLMQGTDFDGDVNAGNYFTGSAFSKPVHGAPFIQNSAEDKVCAYRFFLGDLIPFGSALSLRAEHGNRNVTPLTYSSVIYSYGRPEIALVWSDELEVGDPSSEQAHTYTAQGGQTSQSHTYSFPGTWDDQYFTDAGRTIFGSSSFTINVDPTNRGVRLVRLKDASIFPQAVIVRVNGDSVGLWSDPDYNYFKRWGQSVFEIQAPYSQGLTQLQINLASQSGSQGWSEYRYQVYSHIPPRPDIAPPSRVTGLIVDPLEDGSRLGLTWEASTDDNGVAHYRLYRGTNPGVQPTSQYFIGETPLTIFTDTGLIPGTWYYYLVRAVDFSGNLGDPSDEASSRTSSAYMFEAELLPVTTFSTHDSVYVMPMIGFGEMWSNQTQEQFDADGVGDYFSQGMTVAVSDSYDVSAYFTKGSDYGMLLLKVNGQALGQAVDLYAPAATLTRSSRIELGSLYLDARNHLIIYEVANKNPASSGYKLGVDNLLLTAHSLLGALPQEIDPGPKGFHLYQNRPNPFNASTVVSFELQFSSHVRLTVWDTSGRLVTILSDGRWEAGAHQIVFDGLKFSSGLYFVKMQAGKFTAVRKTLLLK
jgi:hypothetical protein